MPPTTPQAGSPAATSTQEASSVWDIVTQAGLLDSLEAIAGRKRRDWPFASWSAESVTHDTLIEMTGQRTLPTRPEEFLAAFTVHLTRHLTDKYRRKHAKKRGGGCVRRAFELLREVATRTAGTDPDIAGLIDEYVRTRPLLAVIAWMSADLGLTEGEIAALLNIEAESVRKKLRRVKAELRSELDPHD